MSDIYALASEIEKAFQGGKTNVELLEKAATKYKHLQGSSSEYEPIPAVPYFTIIHEELKDHNPDLAVKVAGGVVSAYIRGLTHHNHPTKDEAIKSAKKTLLHVINKYGKDSVSSAPAYYELTSHRICDDKTYEGFYKVIEKHLIKDEKIHQTYNYLESLKYMYDYSSVNAKFMELADFAKGKNNYTTMHALKSVIDLRETNDNDRAQASTALIKIMNSPEFKDNHLAAADLVLNHSKTPDDIEKAAKYALDKAKADLNDPKRHFALEELCETAALIFKKSTNDTTRISALDTVSENYLKARDYDTKAGTFDREFYKSNHIKYSMLIINNSQKPDQKEKAMNTLYSIAVRDNGHYARKEYKDNAKISIAMGIEHITFSSDQLNSAIVTEKLQEYGNNDPKSLHKDVTARIALIEKGDINNPGKEAVKDLRELAVYLENRPNFQDQEVILGNIEQLRKKSQSRVVGS